MLDSFKNWNIFHFTNKTTCSDVFYEVYHFLLDGITVNMTSLVQNGWYGLINAAYTTTLGYYVVKYISENFTLQDDIATYWKVMMEVELVVKT